MEAHVADFTSTVYFPPSTHSTRMSHPLSKWLGRPWPPGFFLPNYPCCSGGGASQAYHNFGGNTGSALQTNYQYVTDVWSAKASLPSPAREHAAESTPSTTGPAFIYGGFGGTSPFVYQQNDSYVPDAWTTKTPMPSPARYEHCGLAINGKAYSWTGITFPAGVYLSQNDQYDPGADSWATKGACPSPPRTFSCASYIGTKGYLFNGTSASNLYNAQNDEYDSGGDSWASRAAPPQATEGSGAWTISSVAYLALGGVTGAPVSITSLYAYTVDNWTTKVSDAAPGRQWFGSASIDASSVAWVTGGHPVGGTLSSQHDEYTPNAWTTRATLPVAMDFQSNSPA